jgi:hypothetical protein
MGAVAELSSGENMDAKSLKNSGRELQPIDITA